MHAFRVEERPLEFAALPAEKHRCAAKPTIGLAVFVGEEPCRVSPMKF
jgi:hypothetical protein